jgi:hypothetical protein
MEERSDPNMTLDLANASMCFSTSPLDETRDEVKIFAAQKLADEMADDGNTSYWDE